MDPQSSLKPHSYEQLIHPIEKRMMQTVWRILHDVDDADDAMQETLSQVLKKIERIRRHPNPHALILRMCANAAYDLLRRKIRQRQRETVVADHNVLKDSAPTPAEHLLQAEDREAIGTSISELPRNQAVAIFMRLVQEQSYDAIAKALGCRPATARVHVNRGRAKLRQKLVQRIHFEIKEAQS